MQGVGYLGNAATNVSYPFSTICLAISLLIGIGSASRFSLLLEMPFLIVTNGLSNLIRADGSPRYSMLCMVSGTIANTILDPIFSFVGNVGIFGAALATVIGQILSFILAVAYLGNLRQSGLAEAISTSLFVTR